LSKALFGDLSRDNFLEHANLDLAYGVGVSICVFRIAVLLLACFGSSLLQEAVLVSMTGSYVREIFMVQMLFPELGVHVLLPVVVFLVWGSYLIYQNGISIYENLLGPARMTSDPVLRVAFYFRLTFLLLWCGVMTLTPERVLAVLGNGAEAFADPMVVRFTRTWGLHIFGAAMLAHHAFVSWFFLLQSFDFVLFHFFLQESRFGTRADTVGVDSPLVHYL
jgi:hypothetical protein